MLMTGVVVISGFVGRYIYTAIPRTADGMEMESGELQRQVNGLELEISRWLGQQPQAYDELARFSTVSISNSVPVLSNPFGDLSYRINMWNLKRKMDPQIRTQAVVLDKLLKRRRTLDWQRRSLVQSRRLMALWHTLHVPIGLALFTAAFIHIVAAIYYATLLR
jgi:hypothetical protein